MCYSIEVEEEFSLFTLTSLPAQTSSESGTTPLAQPTQTCYTKTMNITKQQLFNAIVNELEPDDSELSEWKTFDWDNLLTLVETALDGQSLEEYITIYS